MADNPLAIRVNENVKALFNELAEQGDFENKGEFLNRLLILYQSESMKENVSLIKPAIETVETLMTRLLEVLNWTAASITTAGEKHIQEIEQQKKSFEETRALLQQRIAELEQGRQHDEELMQSFAADKETAENKADELLQKVGQLENTVHDKAALIEGYKEKNDTLNSIVAEYKAAATENKALIETINSMKQESLQQQHKINELGQELRQQTGMLKAEHENLKISLSLEKDTALLELRAEHQQKLQEQLDQYNEKVQSLLERLEAQQTAAPKAKAAPSAGRAKAAASKKVVESTEPATPVE
jgi:chromosome segregation ATPase